MDFQIVEESLLAMIGSFTGQLAADQLADMADLVRHGERGIAFEILCTQLDEYEVPVGQEALSTLRTIAASMEIDPDYCDRLETREERR